MSRKLVQRDGGQALTEYTIIFPGVMVIVVCVTWLLGASIGDIYRYIARLLTEPKPCVTFGGAPDNELCDQHEDCRKTDYGGEESDTFVYEGELSIEAVVIKAGFTYDVRRNNPSQLEYITEDGCYRVTFRTNRAGWERIGFGSECQVVSHVDYWSAPLCE
jgi:hypothetical protein